MSYDIFFIKKKDLTSKDVYTLLESNAIETDKHFVSKQQMLGIKNQLVKQGLKFEIFEKSGEDYLELNFPTYQVSMFNNEIAIAVPYWDSNNSEGINYELKVIINTLLDNGFTGFDPQTSKFITTKFEFKKTFSESKIVVDKAFNENSNSNLKYFGIGLTILIIGFIIWKFIK